MTLEIDLESLVRRMVQEELAKVKRQPEPEWIRMDKAAKLLDVCPRTVKNWAKRGEIELRKDGAFNYVRVEQIKQRRENARSS